MSDSQRQAYKAQQARDTFDPTLAGYDRQEWEEFPDETRDQIITDYHLSFEESNPDPHQMAADADAVAVVTMTLSVKALQNLQQVWEADLDDVGVYEAALRDLFHGLDGHLHLIDDAIGCPDR